MAVYTQLTTRELRRLVRAFGLGRLHAARGVAAGTINSIYDLRTDRGRFILRILEGRSLRDARFEEALVGHLCAAGLPVPAMVPLTAGGHIVSMSPRQHVSVFEYVPGRELARSEIGAEHTRQIGAFLARLHGAAAGLKRRRQNAFSLRRCLGLLARCERAVAHNPAGFGPERAADLAVIGAELRGGAAGTARLPGGIVHGDLFTDNARFARGRLRGVIDFEMASNGAWVYDIAVALCEWGFDRSRFDAHLARSLLAGYTDVRPLSAAEGRALYGQCRFAVGRFALTRFLDFEVDAQPGVHRRYKDYRDYLARLRTLETLGAAGFGRRLG